MHMCIVKMQVYAPDSCWHAHCDSGEEYDHLQQRLQCMCVICGAVCTGQHEACALIGCKPALAALPEATSSKLFSSG
jgi:hypothetical protein